MDTVMAAVERAYEVFARYDLRGDLLVCECPSCVGPAAKLALLKTALKSIPPDLLAEYTHSAHGRSPDPELKHFLPRYFELILENRPPSHWGLDAVLDRLRLADWRRRWPAHEVEAVDEALDVILASSLTEAEPLACEPIEQVLSLVFGAGGEVSRLSGVWERIDTAFATRRLAQAVIAGRGRDVNGPHEVLEAWASFLVWAASLEPGRRLELALMEAGPEDEHLYIDAIKAP